MQSSIYIFCIKKLNSFFGEAIVISFNCFLMDEKLIKTANKYI